MNRTLTERVQNISDISILNPAGELGSDEGNRLLMHIACLLRKERVKIVLNLQKVSHIHLTTLSGLVAMMAMSSALSSLSGRDPFEGGWTEGGIKLANLSAYTRSLLKIAGVDRHFETYDSVAEAVLSFTESPMMAMTESKPSAAWMH